jgi:hypothetical protein
MLAGAIAVLAGMLIRRWAGRYDLKDAAMHSAWTLLRGRRTADDTTAIEARVREIRSQPTWTGKATKAAGTAVGHFLAQIAQSVALILLAVGVALVGAGFLWR